MTVRAGGFANQSGSVAWAAFAARAERLAQRVGVSGLAAVADHLAGSSPEYATLREHVGDAQAEATKLAASARALSGPHLTDALADIGRILAAFPGIEEAHKSIARGMPEGDQRTADSLKLMQGARSEGLRALQAGVAAANQATLATSPPEFRGAFARRWNYKTQDYIAAAVHSLNAFLYRGFELTAGNRLGDRVDFTRTVQVNGREAKLVVEPSVTTDSIITPRGYYSQVAPDVYYFARDDQALQVGFRSSTPFNEDDAAYLSARTGLARDLMYSLKLAREPDNDWARRACFDADSHGNGYRPLAFKASEGGSLSPLWIQNQPQVVPGVGGGDLFVRMLSMVLDLRANDFERLRASTPVAHRPAET